MLGQKLRNESFLALESLPDESKQSFLNYINEQKYIGAIDEKDDFEILESEEGKANQQEGEAPDQNF
jgi:hypothetical protein